MGMKIVKIIGCAFTIGAAICTAVQNVGAIAETTKTADDTPATTEEA